MNFQERQQFLMSGVTADQYLGLGMINTVPCKVMFLASLCLLFMTGCAWKKRTGMDGAGPLKSRAVVISRTVLEPARHFAVTPSRSVIASQELWASPALSKLEGRSRAPVDCDGGLAVLDWLPPEETETMQRFVRNLHGEKGPSPFMVSRVRHYLPVILDALEKYGLPRELAFLPVVESRFRTQAVSPAGAAGLWQIMPDTALRFGLKLSENDDERFDVRKSSDAAAAYLAALHNRFKDWPLALAAYNCGEGALSRALMQTGAGTLPELTAICRMGKSALGVLTRETLEYVPKFVGAVRVMSGLTDLAGCRSRSEAACGGTCDGSLPGDSHPVVLHDREVALQGENIMTGRRVQ